MDNISFYRARGKALACYLQSSLLSLFILAGTAGSAPAADIAERFEVPDLTGTWTVDLDAFDWKDSGWTEDQIYEQHPMVNDTFSIEFTKSEYDKYSDNFKVYYEGLYLHNHGMGVGYSNTATWECPRFEVGYSLSGYFTVPPKYSDDGYYHIWLEGAVTSTPTFYHSTNIDLSIYFTADQVRNSGSTSLSWLTFLDFDSTGQLSPGPQPDPEGECKAELFCEFFLQDCRNSYGWQPFRRTGSGLSVLDARGNISGKLKSSQPLVLLGGTEVEKATVTLSRQDVYIRSQMSKESDEDYSAYLATHEPRQVKSITLEDTDNSSFSFEDLPVLDAITIGGRKAYRLVYYMVEVTNAETIEVDLNEYVPGDPLDSSTPTETTYFSSSTTRNLRPEVGDTVAEKEFLMTPFDGIGVKEALAEILSKQSPNHYKATEDLVQQYLDKLKNDENKSEANLEGLKRAVWAERFAREGARFADTLIESMLDGLADLLTNLIEDLNSFSSKALASKKKELNELRDRYNAEILKKRGWHRIDDTTIQSGRIRESIDKLWGNERVAISESARIIKMGLKHALAFIKSYLIGLGLNAESVETYIGGIQKVSFSLLDLAIHQGLGALEQTAKYLVSEYVKGKKGELLDGKAAYSYCANTSEYLVKSNEYMQSWSTSDMGAYVSDREKTVEKLIEMSNEYTAVLTSAIWAKFVGEAADLGETTADAIGLVIPAGRVAAMLAKVAKYSANTANIAAPGIMVFRTRGFVEEGVYQAFGKDAPARVIAANPARVEAPVLVAANARLATAAQTAHIALDAVLEKFADNMTRDYIPDAVFLAGGDEPEAFLPAADRFARFAEAFTLQATAADTAGYGVRDLLESVADFRAWTIELSSLSVEVFMKVLLLDYAGPDDPVYMAERNHVVATIRTLQAKADSLLALIETVSTATSAAQTLPVVVFESLKIVSEAEDNDTISASPQDFTLHAHVHNLGGVAVSGLTAAVFATSATVPVSVSPSQEITIAGGTLAADDGVDGSGADEGDISWTFRYEGNLDAEERIVLAAEILEQGASPASFITLSETLVLEVDAALSDTDLDGLPNSYEEANGLNKRRDDYSSDLDGDGIENGREYELGTLPDEADTDGDGLSDGEEVTGGKDGFVTDPLDADSDDDGTGDADDGDPLDAATAEAAAETPEEPVVSMDTDQVVLTAETPMQVLTVGNSGSGTLVWTAASLNEAVAVTSVDTSDVHEEGYKFMIMVPGSYIFETPCPLETTVRVADAAGATQDYQDITVTVMPSDNDTGVDCDQYDSPGDGGSDNCSLLFVRPDTVGPVRLPRLKRITITGSGRAFGLSSTVQIEDDQGNAVRVIYQFPAGKNRIAALIMISPETAPGTYAVSVETGGSICTGASLTVE